MSKARQSSQSAPSVSIGLRSCGCARRFVPTLPQHSQSAPVLARRRSRSSTGSSSRSPAASSGRDTPSPSPAQGAKTSKMKHRARSEGHLADVPPPPEPVRTDNNPMLGQRPVCFSSSLLIRVSNNRRHLLEYVKYEIKFGQEHISQDEQNDPCQPQQFRNELEIRLDDNGSVEETSNANQT